MLLVAAHENISLFVVALIVTVFLCICVYLPQKDTIHFLNSLESLVMLASLWGCLRHSYAIS